MVNDISRLQVILEEKNMSLKWMRDTQASLRDHFYTVLFVSVSFCKRMQRL